MAKPEEPRLHRWLKRAAWVLGLIGVGIGVYFVGRAFLPRWWAHRIGAQVSGSIAAGIALGLFYGFAFTFLPLFVLWRGLRRRRPWRHWLAFVVGAIVLASPNLLTLGIVIGTGHAAHAGERTLDVEAPAFRTSVLIGAIVALLAFASMYYLLFSRRRAHGKVAKLRERLRAREAEQEAAAESESGSPDQPPAAG